MKNRTHNGIQLLCKRENRKRKYWRKRLDRTKIRSRHSCHHCRVSEKLILDELAVTQASTLGGCGIGILAVVPAPIPTLK